MSSQSRPYLYLLGAVVLAAIILWIDRPSHTLLNTDHQKLFTRFDSQQVAIIEIEQLLNGVQLVRKDTQWQVLALQTALQKEAIEKSEAQTFAHEENHAYPVEAERVQQILELMSTLAVGPAASRTVQHHDQLQVGKLALQVRAKNVAGETLASLFVGKGGPDFFSTYVRKADDDTVYLVAEQLQGRFPTRVDAWRDKTIWKLDPDQISAIEVDRMDGGFRLNKNADGQFVLQSPQSQTALDINKLKSWLARWTNLRAQDFPATADNAQTGLEKPLYTLTITLANGERHVLKLGKEASSGNPYGMLAGAEQVFLAPTDLRSALQVDWEDWLSAAAPSQEASPSSPQS